ncbi:hypothetical protein EV192_113164 [Actinocrispum wychmicini]|uniref:Uncharacterized protein n=2 Tax=Actinocrispum wychmicini TaxID=1213861 RepID=A0A4R2IYV9_9PSEU|nr:hypothetical protein EV192_113164 [Actinocrispum wychmicini]
MTSADDEYVDQHFVPLTDLSADPEWVRAEMVAGRVPLPSYLRSDGVEMVPSDLLSLAEEAGGTSELAEWFGRQSWPDEATAAEEWESYLSGQYVCLRSVTPRNIQRKGDLVSAIKTELEQPQPDSRAWVERLHGLVDALESVELPFTDYDRLRFAGPVSRDTYIDQVRAKYPAGQSLPAAVR